MSANGPWRAAKQAGNSGFWFKGESVRKDSGVDLDPQSTSSPSVIERREGRWWHSWGVNGFVLGFIQRLNHRSHIAFDQLKLSSREEVAVLEWE